MWIIIYKIEDGVYAGKKEKSVKVSSYRAKARNWKEKGSVDSCGILFFFSSFFFLFNR